MDFWKVMSDSISDNVLIFIAAVVAFVLLVFSIILSIVISKQFDTSNGSKLNKTVYYLLDVIYTLFITIVSFFPLLGMLGTVTALIGLGGVFQTDVGADMDSIKPQFFLALTSTAWGIVFSLGFKVVNSLFQPFIENQIEKAKKALGI